jgi:hypothetical protein
VWQVKPEREQSWQRTPFTPQLVAEVPLLQFPPESQHPEHCGHEPASVPAWEVVDAAVLVLLDREVALVDVLVVRLPADVVLPVLEELEPGPRLLRTALLPVDVNGVDVPTPALATLVDPPVTEVTLPP